MKEKASSIKTGIQEKKQQDETTVDAVIIRKPQRKKKTLVVDNSIIKHNDMVSGRVDFTACQLDIFLIILRDLNPQSSDIEYKINANDIEALTGRKWSGKMLEESLTELSEKKIEITLRKHDFKIIWFFQSLESFHEQEYWQVLLSNPIIPYLQDFKNSFMNTLLVNTTNPPEIENNPTTNKHSS